MTEPPNSDQHSSDQRFPEPIRSVPATSGTLDAVLTTARRRRARRLQAVGGGTAALLLVAGLAVTLRDGSGNQTLGVTDGGNTDRGAVIRSDEAEPTPHPSGGTPGEASAVPGSPPPSSDVDPEPTGEPTPEPTDARPTPSPAPSGQTSAYPTPTKSMPPGRTPPPYPTSKPSPQPSSPAPAPTGEPSEAARGDMRRIYINATTQCGSGQPWCGSARLTGSRPVDFFLRVCRSADAGAGTLSVPASQADFAVEQGGRQLWRWSSGRAFPAIQGTLEFGAGDCYEWSTTWQGVDDGNRRLPAGRYAVKAIFSSEEFPAGYDLTLDLA